MEDVLAICRQYCKTQRIKPLIVRVMGDHCFLRKDVPHDRPSVNMSEPQNIVAPSRPCVTSSDILPSMENLKTILPCPSVVSFQNFTTASSSPSVSMALKALATSTVPTMTTANMSIQIPCVTASPSVSIALEATVPTMTTANTSKQIPSVTTTQPGQICVVSSQNLTSISSKPLVSMALKTFATDTVPTMATANISKQIPLITAVQPMQVTPVSSQNLTVSSIPTVSKTKMASVTRTVPTMTTANVSKHIPTVTTAQPGQVIRSPVLIPNLPKQLASLVGNKSAVMLSVGDLKSGSNLTNLPKAVLEKLQALRKTSSGSRQRVFIVKTNSARSLIKPTSEAISDTLSNSDVVTINGPPEVIECTPSLPDNDEETNSADECIQEPSTFDNILEEESEFPQLKISNVTSVNDDDDVAPKALPLDEDYTDDSDNFCELVSPDLVKSPYSLNVDNEGNMAKLSNNENEKPSDERKRRNACAAALVEELNGFDACSSTKHSVTFDNLKAFEKIQPNGVYQNEFITNERLESDIGGSIEFGKKTPMCLCNVEAPAVVIFVPKNSPSKTEAKEAPTKLTVKIHGEKQHLHPVIHALIAIHQHQDVLPASTTFQVKVHINGACQNIDVTSDNAVQSLRIGNLSYIFPVHHAVNVSDLDRFAKIAIDKGCGWTTTGTLILKPSADKLYITKTSQFVKKETLVCPDCKMSFDSLPKKSSHMLDCRQDLLHTDRNDSDKFVCKICQFKCPSLRRLYFHHFYQHHIHLPDNVAQFRCGLCPTIEYSFVMLKDHYYRYHRGIDKFVCQNCDFTSKLLSTMRAHTKLSHSERPCFQCECGRSFRRRCRLENHRKTHMPRTESKYP